MDKALLDNEVIQNSSLDHRDSVSRRKYSSSALLYIDREDNESPLEPVAIDGVKIESLNYGVMLSDVYKDDQRARAPSSWIKATAAQWFLTFAIGVVTAMFGALLSISVHNITEFKFHLVESLKDNKMAALFTYLAVNMTLVTISVVLSSIEPSAIGSGIPEVKSLLNGMKISRIVRIRTLFVKVVGIIAAVCGGLPLGKEGPMIHAGAIVAAGLSQGKSTYMGFDVSFSKFQNFRNDNQKRDFISCGAASGVASAFGAPIGGILFALEEGSSFWSQSLTWRTFFCTMISATTVASILSQFLHNRELGGIPGMFNFADFTDDTSQSPYKLWELPIFLGIGGIGGLVGATFNSLNMRLSKIRQRIVQRGSPKSILIKKVFEGILVSVLVSSVCFIIPHFILAGCSEIPKDENTNTTEVYVQLDCDDGKFSPAASVFFTSPEKAIKLLFHSPEFTFDGKLLVPGFFIFLGLTCITYGTSVPSGLFIPMLLSGSLIGRWVGQIIGSSPAVGTYSLVGAGAVLGGMARITISLTVIMIECTGDIRYGLPLMLTLSASKFVGDWFGPGLYDMIIRKRGWPFLEAEPPAAKLGLTVNDVMNSRVHSLSSVCTVKQIIQALQGQGEDGVSSNAVAVMYGIGFAKESSNSKPDGSSSVISKEEQAGQKFFGYVLGYQLTTILKRKVFAKTAEEARSASLILPWSAFEAAYPRYPSFASVTSDGNFNQEELNSWVNLEPYMHKTPLTMYPDAPVQQAYTVFRTLGLRHLWILSRDSQQVVGLVTRKSLTEEWIELREKMLF